MDEIGLGFEGRRREMGKEHGKIEYWVMAIKQNSLAISGNSLLIWRLVA